MVPPKTGGGSAGPYRGCKFTLWEGGIRVPCIVSQPGRLPQGEVRTQVATSLDWFPTIAEYCGVALPRQDLDGRSLTAVIESEEARSPHRTWTRWRRAVCASRSSTTRRGVGRRALRCSPAITRSKFAATKCRG